MTRRPEGGHIVTIGSVAGMLGANLCTAYSGSKAAVSAFHESLFTELRTSSGGRVRSTLVCPWYMSGTGMFSGAAPSVGGALPAGGVASRILQAVQLSEPYVILPPALAYFLPLKTVLPIELGWALAYRVAKSPQAMLAMYNNNNTTEKTVCDPPAA